MMEPGVCSTRLRINPFQHVSSFLIGFNVFIVNAIFRVKSKEHFTFAFFFGETLLSRSILSHCNLEQTDSQSDRSCCPPCTVLCMEGRWQMCVIITLYIYIYIIPLQSGGMMCVSLKKRLFGFESKANQTLVIPEFSIHHIDLLCQNFPNHFHRLNTVQGFVIESSMPASQNPPAHANNFITGHSHDSMEVL